MRLIELLGECRRTFLSQCQASMQRDGLGKEQMSEILESTATLLDEYNAHVLQTLAGTLSVVNLPPINGGGNKA